LPCEAWNFRMLGYKGPMLMFGTAADPVGTLLLLQTETAVCGRPPLSRQLKPPLALKSAQCA